MDLRAGVNAVAKREVFVCYIETGFSGKVRSTSWTWVSFSSTLVFSGPPPPPPIKLDGAPFPSAVHLCCWITGRSRWPRGLRRMNVAVRLLGLRIRIPSGSWMFILWVLCVVQVKEKASATGRSLVQGSPTECVCVSVIGCNNNPLHLKWVGRRRHTKIERLGISIKRYTSVDAVRKQPSDCCVTAAPSAMFRWRANWVSPGHRRWLCVFIPCFKTRHSCDFLNEPRLTLTLLTWRMWWAPTNASKWQMGFNSAFKELTRDTVKCYCLCIVLVGPVELALITYSKGMTSQM